MLIEFANAAGDFIDCWVRRSSLAQRRHTRATASGRSPPCISVLRWRKALISCSRWVSSLRCASPGCAGGFPAGRCAGRFRRGRGSRAFPRSAFRISSSLRRVSKSLLFSETVSKIPGAGSPAPPGAGAGARFPLPAIPACPASHSSVPGAMYGWIFIRTLDFHGPFRIKSILRASGERVYGWKRQAENFG